MIKIELVNEKTFSKILDMKLPKEQNCFVAPNIVSLAQAWLYHKIARPFAILNDDEIVGFVMLDWDEEERTVGLWRFMIDFEQQNKGYGRKALEEVFKIVKEADKFDLFHTDYVANNTIARNLYYSFGLRENGDIEDGEIVMTLKLNDHPKVGMITADEDDYDDYVEIKDKEEKNQNVIPSAFLNNDTVKKHFQIGDIKRFTIYGETIALYLNNELLFDHEYKDYYIEVLGKIKQLCIISGEKNG